MLGLLGLPVGLRRLVLEVHHWHQQLDCPKHHLSLLLCFQELQQRLDCQGVPHDVLLWQRFLLLLVQPPRYYLELGWLDQAPVQWVGCPRAVRLVLMQFRGLSRLAFLSFLRRHQPSARIVELH